MIVDESAEIADAYGIPAAPFFFALDENSNIVQRIPYMPDTAAHTLNLILGLEGKPLDVRLIGAG